MDKKEIKELDNLYKVYTTLEILISKKDNFTPKNVTEVLITGMKMLAPIKDLSGVQKKEKLISLVKLLIKENANLSDWMTFDLDMLGNMIDQLYTSGIGHRKKCFCL